MENKDLLKLLEKMGVEVKGVHSTLDDSDVERVKNHLNLSRKEGLVEQRVKPTVIRRRVKKEEAPPVPEPAAPVAAQPPAEKPAEKKAPAPEAPRKEEAPPAGRPLEKKVVEAKEESPPKRPEEVPPPLKPAPPVPLAAEEKREEKKVEESKPGSSPNLPRRRGKSRNPRPDPKPFRYPKNRRPRRWSARKFWKSRRKDPRLSQRRSTNRQRSSSVLPSRLPRS